MGTASCPHCGHIHSCSFEVKRTREYQSGTRHESTVCTNPDCQKRFIIERE